MNEREIEEGGEGEDEDGIETVGMKKKENKRDGRNRRGKRRKEG